MAMSRLCLDTSAYSNFKRGHGRVTELIDSAEWIGLPAIVVGELWTGFILGRRREENSLELEEFMANRSSKSCRSIPTSPESMRKSWSNCAQPERRFLRTTFGLQR